MDIESFLIFDSCALGGGSDLGVKEKESSPLINGKHQAWLCGVILGYSLDGITEFITTEPEPRGPASKTEHPAYITASQSNRLGPGEDVEFRNLGRSVARFVPWLVHAERSRSVG